MNDSEDHPTGHLHPLRQKLRDARSEPSDVEDGSIDAGASARGRDPHVSAASGWPAWAVVDWEQLDRPSGQTKLRGLSDIAVPLAATSAFATVETRERDEVIEVSEISEISEGAEGSEEETVTRAEGSFIPEVVLETPQTDSALALPPARLAELLQEAAYAAQEARERAARAEGEAQVLRYELEREREERERLTMELTRRRWFPRRG